eukprot:10598106-Ditylum_brightwellii.AAC.1
MAEKEGEEDKMESKLSSICDQNILAIEIYPNSINMKCPGFSSECSKCRLSHPKLDEFRGRVIIANIGYKLLYIAHALDINVHAGMSRDMCLDYIRDLKRKTYKVIEAEEFHCNKKEILII